jgi:hypothetical protein
MAASSLSAQDRAAAGANVEVRRISNILKTKVVIQDDKPAGEIVDVVYNEGGCIDYYVASYDNRQYVVPFDVVQYRSADRVVFIDVAPAQFERVQFFSANQWPDIYAPTFRDQVFASFNVRSGGRNRTTFRQGADVNVEGRNRTDVDARTRTDVDARTRTDADAKARPDAARDRDAADRNRPEASDRDRDRPNQPADRPERKPEAGDRPSAEPRDNTPAPPRAGSGTNPGRDGAAPPKAGSDTNPGRGSNPPAAGVNPGSGSDKAPPARPEPKADDKKPLTPPPVVPK